MPKSLLILLFSALGSFAAIGNEPEPKPVPEAIEITIPSGAKIRARPIWNGIEDLVESAEVEISFSVAGNTKMGRVAKISLPNPVDPPRISVSAEGTSLRWGSVGAPEIPIDAPEFDSSLAKWIEGLRRHKAMPLVHVRVHENTETMHLVRLLERLHSLGLKAFEIVTDD